MPEVAIAEDHETLRREDDIRTSRQSRDMEAIAESTTPELTPQSKLASRVRLRAGTPCCGGCACGSRMQSCERGRAAHALVRLHRGRILPMTTMSSDVPLSTGQPPPLHPTTLVVLVIVGSRRKLLASTALARLGFSATFSANFVGSTRPPPGPRRSLRIVGERPYEQDYPPTR
jgi:hypothetical protein